ncbi:acetyl-CoA C-acyltransferase family protein [Pseudorhodoplanes sp.]|uniref:acetyl-CoA C-acyltransferase family protein n=1 Tax=Pseudorhodoplanes sp. TaxID=1934341 RepID=UPI002C69F217|nr:acetyl-CoA C-acyltransferase family protein [Pseudorhodoplanes sp.]HWK68894.1 acetyl-CoA C-acyltransferase family protein [Rhizobiaceae bacterium]HWV41023.1 acetyl-CoA C-acyltransferase family protein [Pseudorhodoplanes sp.]
MTEAVYILSGVRTAIGTFGGTLSNELPAALGARVAAEAVQRAGVEAGEIGHVVYGNVIPTGPKDAYLARVAAIDAGIPKEVPAMTLNRLCGSGAQAIVSAAQNVMLGDTDVALAGGAEVMSRAPHYVQSARFGQKMGDVTMLDGLTGVLTDPFGNGIMGVTAENVAEKYRISRQDQDAFALESQRRAAAAIEAGHFKSQILPLEVTSGRKTVTFDTDEHPKPATTLETLASLRPAFKKDGMVTAGNSSGVNDGAAAVVLASERYVDRSGAKPLGRIVAYAHSGVEPGIMGIGPVPAVRALVDRAGIKVTDFDVIESNEAFASQALAVGRELGLDPAKVNPDGGAIALGHPVGATGAILTVKALYYLQRTGGRYGLVTMCIGGGQGIALAIERV